MPFDPERDAIVRLVRDAAIGKTSLKITINSYETASIVRFAGRR
jgi:hypothetical protein